MTRFRFIAMVSVTLCVAPSIAWAHQQKEAYISLLFNLRTDKVEVSHRFSIHDAQHLLKTLLGSSDDLASSPTAQELFSNYLESKFQIADENQNLFSLSRVGHEVETKYFWLYQEFPIPSVEALLVRDMALFEAWPTQINYVNIEKSGWVRSARLSKDNPYKLISLLD